MLEATHFVDESATSYATVADFRETFTDEMQGRRMRIPCKSYIGLLEHPAARLLLESLVARP